MLLAGISPVRTPCGVLALLILFGQGKSLQLSPATVIAQDAATLATLDTGNRSRVKLPNTGVCV